ncbi:TetR/AcrR family transcriptional regulator [soil metagenome]
MTGLRERRHLETKQLLVETAFDLFVERCFTNVSMAEVAQAAGVSRSTLYRRFPAKDDLVLEVPNRWIVVFDHAVGALPLDASIGDAIGEPALAVAAHIDQNKEIVRTAYQLLEMSPTLQQAGLVTTTWLGRIAAIFERFSSADAEMSLVLAGAYFGAIDAMMLHWATADVTSSVTEMTTRLLARLEPILPPNQTG